MKLTPLHRIAWFSLEIEQDFGVLGQESPSSAARPAQIGRYGALFDSINWQGNALVASGQDSAGIIVSKGAGKRLFSRKVAT